MNKKIEDLATMVADSFQRIENILADHTKRFESIENILHTHQNKLSNHERRIGVFEQNDGIAEVSAA